MKTIKVLNLYACLGGNRYKWDEVAQEAGIDMQVVAVEWDEELARLYQERFPNDTVIVADAHQYLLDHYKEFDFIWSSPPCPSHSKARGWNSKVETKYPDMKLYEEIILLETVSKGENPRFKGMYVVENVIPYYEPLIEAKKRGRHLYWTNFNLPNILSQRKGVEIGGTKNEVKKWCEFHNYNFYNYKGKQPTNKIARNLVDYEAGRTIFETYLGIERKKDINQTSIFDI
jgi:DNA (cytosine-5)-methyltransferase 1